ncbi:flavin monoamine oxidase family protein [Pseudemcibacter aquimaris]|uniref:flavin monoamine oxidase family protein n=1 Tax=Pseudemcibacter aquimaris TaxID=2857064 RepID=UPI0020135EB3|nr:flavin monoamine oxidase family protein [Pseudemcibacter aquimaris]MCC3862057.1 flavin monoamine oxidase family protein [Pseudemcibacter aquimaris]WDU58809.1 flavin monoamine oxidase family protein [Pseudemcibacter aquimaris]
MTKTENSQPTAITKRSFLQSVGMIGGTAAVMTALQGWDMGFASEVDRPPEMSTDGNGKKVIILGAGLAGMVLAYEMSKKGYKTKIIEALDYAGGRCVSARKGHVIEEIGGEKQVCNFQDGNYVNYGPWRIPAEHKSTIYYCRTLGVPLEVLVNKSGKSYYYYENKEGAFKGQPVRQELADIDFKGYSTELLAKVADQGGLDQLISQEDKEKLLENLRRSGLINSRELNYRANRARGHSVYPGAGTNFGELSEPFALADALSITPAARNETADHPPVMFQAVGGMDQIAQGLKNALKKNQIRYNSEVTDVVQDDNGVKVTYKNTQNGRVRTEEADYVISTAPLGVMQKMNINLSEDFANAMKATNGNPACKIGVEMDHRFWEQEEMIYGGVTSTDIPGHRILAYPSGNLFGQAHGDTGVILGYYPIGGQSVPISNLSMSERIEFALSVGEKVHPGKYRKHFTGEAMSVAWHKMKYALAGWENWTRRGRTRAFPIVHKGDNRIFVSGNIASPALGGWMAGAIEGAWSTMEVIDKRVAQQG